MKVILIVWVGMLTLMGCTKELGFDLPYEGDRLVLYGILSPDSVATLLVSRTYPPTGRYLYGRWVTSATVRLYEDSVFIDELRHQKDGRYVSTFKPKAGKSYHYTVFSSEYGEAVSQPERIPNPLAIQSYEFSESIAALVNPGKPARKLICHFTDDPTTTDFYALQLAGFQQGSPVALNSFGLDRPDDYGDGCGFKSQGQLNQYNLSDVCFSGQSTAARVGVELEGPVQPSGRNVEVDKLTLTLVRSNRGYYEYQRTFNASEGFLQAFQPPQVRYSNVKGGYGIILAYSTASVAIQL